MKDGICPTYDQRWSYLRIPPTGRTPFPLVLRAAIFGACGHTEIYTRVYEDLPEAHKMRFVSAEPD